jgi:hypothetical protein
VVIVEAECAGPECRNLSEPPMKLRDPRTDVVIEFKPDRKRNCLKD